MHTDIPSAYRKRIIFLNNLIWKPELPNFSCKYELFSINYEGIMFHFSGGYEIKKAGNFDFMSLPFSNNPLKYFRYLFFCTKHILRNRRVDYIISYDPGIFCLIGLFLKKLCDAKLIAEVNVDHFEGAEFTSSGLKLKVKKVFINLVTRLALKRADAVKFVSKKMHDSYKEKFDFAHAKHFFSYISTHVFKLDRCSDNGYILFVGHPFKLKGVDVLIKAFQRISGEFPELNLKIIGHCDDRTEFEAIAAGNSNIHFQKGTEYDKIIAEFERCKLFVLPSRTEGIPRVLVEAMACGKPVIGSRVGGIPQIISDEKTGLLFESENDEDLANKIHRLLIDTDFAKRLGENAAQRVAQVFSPDHYIKLYHEFLSNIQ
jgi:glycosyltransferase involved in cell wall biosynthesis